MFMQLTTPVAPTEYLVNGVVEYLASLSPGEFAALVAAARPPSPPDPDEPADIRGAA